jgi:hypothetical protein
MSLETARRIDCPVARVGAKAEAEADNVQIALKCDEQRTAKTRRLRIILLEIDLDSPALYARRERTV